MSGLFLALMVGLVVASIVAFAATMLLPSGDSNATEDRLSEMATRQRRVATKDNEHSIGSLMLGSEEGNKLFESIAAKMPALSDYLEQADVKLSPAKFTMVCTAFFAVGVVVCAISPVPVLLGPILGILLTGLPVGWLVVTRNRRLAKFGNQMPEALELLSRSLRAGHSLNAGFQLVASELQAPLAPEFGRCFEEQNLGIPLEEAIEDMAKRIPNMDLRFFATAILLQRQTGGDLAEILDKIGKLVRERITIQGQIQALTGEGRMSGIVLLAMPPTLFLVMLKMNFDYVVLLFTDPLGKIFLSVALVSQIIGAIVIKKIITIKV